MSTDGSKEAGLFIKAMQIPLSAEATAADLTYKILQLLMKDPANRDISSTVAKAVKHQDATLIEVNDFGEAADLMKKFEENGIYYAAKVSMQINGEDKVGVVVMNQDLQQALAVTDNFYAERFGGLCSSSFLESYSNGSMMEIKGLSAEETELFMSRCKEHHIPISVTGPENEQYRIRYAEKDSEKMARIRADTAVSMSGPAKDCYQHELEWSDRYTSAAMNAIISSKYPDGASVQEGSALVGADGKSVEITRQYIKLYQGDTVKRISRNTTGKDLEQSITEVSLFVKGMEQPVFLDQSQFRTFRDLPTEERGDYLSNIQRTGLLLPSQIYKDDLVKTATRDRSPDGTRFRIGDTIADAKGNEIEVQRDVVLIRQKNKKDVFYDRDSDEARQAIREAIRYMEKPVYLEASRAQEYRAMDEDQKREFIESRDRELRTYVEPRHMLTQEELRAIAKAEAMRHTVEVRLKADGFELPQAETMSYHDAIHVFGLKGDELEQFNSAMAATVTAQAPDHEIEDVLDDIVDRFVSYEPQTAHISAFERWEDRDRDEHGLDIDISGRDDLFHSYDDASMIDDAFSHD